MCNGRVHCDKGAIVGGLSNSAVPSYVADKGVDARASVFMTPTRVTPYYIQDACDNAPAHSGFAQVAAQTAGGRWKGGAFRDRVARRC
jgi:hypothetical protein